MGGAIARHLSFKHQVILYDHREEKAKGLAKELGAEYTLAITDLPPKAEIILLAVKPKDLKYVSQELLLGQEHLLISVLAGTSLATLKTYFPEPEILRIMPNLGVICGQGVIGLVDELSSEWKKKAVGLFEGQGTLLWLPESQIDALTALTGSGPAFIAHFIEGMIEGGVQLGFTSEEAHDLVLQTLEGTLTLLRSLEMSPAMLKTRVASPGGTTMAGLKALEAQEVQKGIVAAFLAAYERALEMQSQNPI
jgi:pyrroline-5-carboxylate reductase